MKTVNKPHSIEFHSEDGNGPFIFRLLKDASQIQLDTEDGDVYIDVNRKELTAIRDILTKVIESK